MDKLIVRAAVWADDDVLLDEVEFHPEFIDLHHVSKVSIEPVSFLANDCALWPELFNVICHPPKHGATLLRSAISVQVLALNQKAVLLRIFTKQCELRIQRVAFFALLGGADSGIHHARATGVTLLGGVLHRHKG
ncbi:MAG: hypothetical protein MUC92_02735 [Fimbriimonadaceae bacterium]|nr:hypothetical protein [Fimbriimonadaceae bacterium]